MSNEAWYSSSHDWLISLSKMSFWFTHVTIHIATPSIFRVCMQSYIHMCAHACETLKSVSSVLFHHSPPTFLRNDLTEHGAHRFG